MVYATLSADIVKSTSFSANDTFRLRKYLQSFIDNNLAKGTDRWGRIIKGDGLELVETNPNNILRFALMLRKRGKIVNRWSLRVFPSPLHFLRSE